MFWERSDTSLSDEEIRGLKDVVLTKAEAHAALIGYHFFCGAGLPMYGTFHRCFRIDTMDS